MNIFLHKYRPLSLLALSVLVLLFNGCAAKKEQPDTFFQEWRAKAETSQAYLPAKKEFEEKFKKQSAETQEQQPQPEPKMSPAERMQQIGESLPANEISVRFIDDDLATVLRTLGRLAKQNMIISPSVQGKVNTHIENTPWNKVFMGLIKSYGLAITREDNLLQVMSIDDLKKQVERKSLAIEEELVAPLATQIVPIEFAEPKDIAESARQSLSKAKDGTIRGSVSVDSHSRSLIVRDTEANMEKILRLIYDLDQLTPQILIEAHIVETTKDTARELGVRWGALTKHVLGDSRVQLSPGDAVYTPNSPLAGLGNNVDMGAEPIGGISAGTLGLLVNGNDILLNAQLSALQRDGKLNILSSPSIVTLDNSQAIIESGRDIPFTTVDADNQLSVNYREASLKLTVTPHVISNALIRLDIDAKKDEPDFDNDVQGNPLIIKKTAKTQLIVENGAIVVLAGLSKETYSGSNTGVPGLKDIPILGRLFKTTSKADTFEDLLIFITPKILTSENTAQALQPAASNQIK